MSACKKRFEYKLSDGTVVDHRYLFSKAGYNVRGDELRAAIGLAQVRKVDGYEAVRKRNFSVLDGVIRPMEDVVIPPQSLPGAEPSWFAYPITLHGEGKREAVVQALEEKGIQTRTIFCGNATLHPFMFNVAHLAPFGLANSTKVARDAFAVGLNQTITEEEIHYIAKTLREVIVDLAH
jgi:CDP-6-deoxy-D-xylo-4-hexulose-3-dehydrase